MKHKIKIGIIGGSGLGNPDLFRDRVEKKIDTIFGPPSDVLIEGNINGVQCVLLARHGRNHTIMPSNVNYRANIYALKSLGCTHILVSTACGSLREELQPGDLVILDSFVDRTTKRTSTFFDGQNQLFQGVCHMPMEPAFCKETRNVLIECAKELNLRFHPTGTVVTIEGPRFSSRAESKLLKSWGCDVVNMTTVPEVVLAKEAGLCYAAVAVVTDYDSWKDTGNFVNVEDVLAAFMKNISKVTDLLVSAVGKICGLDWDETIEAAEATVQNNVMLPASKGDTKET